MSAAGLRSGSARVSRVGDGVTPSRTSVETNQAAGARYYRQRLPHFERPWAVILRDPLDSGVAKQNQDYPWIWTQHDEARDESSFRRDAETSTRNACATQRRES